MKIVTDSAADLPAEEVQAHGIAMMPLTIQFPGEEVKSNDISPDEFYNRLRAMVPNVPTTAQPAAGEFESLYRRIAQEDPEILSIHISSGLSGTIDSARLGAEHVPEADVTHFDTLTLSGGERFHVLAAAMAAEAGWDREAILARLKQLRGKVEIIYTLETLDYLARGGRIGRVQALAGSLLRIKPVIHVEKADGKYSTTGRGRTIGKAMDVIAAFLKESFGNEPVWVSVLHGQLEDQAGELEGLLKGSLNVAKSEVLRISPVLGVHTGPGVVGAGVAPMRLMEDLL